ncbi:hypothetical protein B0H17DRAFT_1139521 [Mycena rosella]|uniref:Uncharacterized protein n=1 Tax=Mycena rosella TaxID=1033263 RepID=A0AAD7D410_MYCRO|nr:hypothetical protein B0H17DRAFT_1139521 [Mycena rosella]
MPPHKKTTLEQQEFIQTWMPEFLLKQGRKTLEAFWPKMRSAYLSEWPEEVVLGLPLQTVDRDPNAEPPVPLTDAERKRLTDALETRFAKLRNSFYNEAAKIRKKRGGVSRSSLSLAAMLFKQRPKAKRRHQVLEVYQKEQKEKIRDALSKSGYDKLNEATQCRTEDGDWVDDDDDEVKMKRLATARKERMQLFRRVVQQVWDSETEAVKQGIREKAQKEVVPPATTDEMLEGVEGAETERTPQEYQMSIDESGQVAEMFLQEFQRMTGWMGVLVYGGPIPRLAGRLGVRAVPFGAIPGGLTFDKWHPDFKKRVTDPLVRFLRQAIPRDVRLSRGIFDEDNDKEGEDLDASDTETLDSPAKKTKTNKRKSKEVNSAATKDKQPDAPEKPAHRPKTKKKTGAPAPSSTLAVAQSSQPTEQPPVPSSQDFAVPLSLQGFDPHTSLEGFDLRASLRTFDAGPTFDAGAQFDTGRDFEASPGFETGVDFGTHGSQDFDMGGSLLEFDNGAHFDSQGAQESHAFDAGGSSRDFDTGGQFYRQGPQHMDLAVAQNWLSHPTESESTPDLAPQQSPSSQRFDPFVGDSTPTFSSTSPFGHPTIFGAPGQKTSRDYAPLAPSQSSWGTSQETAGTSSTCAADAIAGSTKAHTTDTSLKAISSTDIALGARPPDTIAGSNDPHAADAERLKVISIASIALDARAHTANTIASSTDTHTSDARPLKTVRHVLIRTAAPVSARLPSGKGSACKDHHPAQTPHLNSIPIVTARWAAATDVIPVAVAAAINKIPTRNTSAIDQRSIAASALTPISSSHVVRGADSPADEPTAPVPTVKAAPPSAEEVAKRMEKARQARKKRAANPKSKNARGGKNAKNAEEGEEEGGGERGNDGDEPSAEVEGPVVPPGATADTPPAFIFTISNNNGARARAATAAEKLSQKLHHNPDGPTPLVILPRPRRAAQAPNKGTPITFQQMKDARTAQLNAKQQAEDDALIRKLTSGKGQGKAANGQSQSAAGTKRKAVGEENAAPSKR